MKTLQERATEFATHPYSYTFGGTVSTINHLEQDSYTEGAKDQQKIDADLAAEWIKNNGADFCLGENSFDGSFAADMLQKFILNQ